MDNQCPMHNEFSRRVDDRMAAHELNHISERNILCTKLDKITEDVDKLKDKADKMYVRLNMVLGGFSALWLIVQLAYMYLSATKK